MFSRSGAGVLIVLAATSACTSQPPTADSRSYEQQIRDWRAEKDAAFRTDKDSPIPESQRARFAGLPYYPIDEAYHAPAFLTQQDANPPVVIELQTTANQRQRMRRVGTLGFAIGGVPYKLAAFVEADTRDVGRLFVPFGDLTNGNETYHGGRFLELDRTTTGLYDIDFNRAYHPSCVYNSAYDCPIPPMENRLPVAIRAGERLTEGVKNK